MLDVMGSQKLIPCMHYYTRVYFVVVVYVTAAVQHFSNKTGPSILVNVISFYHRVDCKGFYFRQLRRYCTCSIPQFYMLESTRFQCRMIKGFADIVIADITAGQINHYFAEIAPRIVYLLYAILCFR